MNLITPSTNSVQLSTSSGQQMHAQNSPFPFRSKHVLLEERYLFILHVIALYCNMRKTFLCTCSRHNKENFEYSFVFWLSQQRSSSSCMYYNAQMQTEGCNIWHGSILHNPQRNCVSRSGLGPNAALDMQGFRYVFING